MFKRIGDFINPLRRSPPSIELLEPIGNMRMATGTIVNLTDMARAAGLNGEELKEQQMDQFRRGVSPLAIEFSEPVSVGDGFFTKIAEIPRDFGEASLYKIAQNNVGGTAAVAITTDPSRKSRVVFMNLDSA